mmetsp:Transcript_25079/g.72314  ORF Transcript_25079/g.72314 Transcript_25079/m.72314 type:complete len:391 (-) Transcript_25079:7-1179(-)
MFGLVRLRVEGLRDRGTAEVRLVDLVRRLPQRLTQLLGVVVCDGRRALRRRRPRIRPRAEDASLVQLVALPQQRVLRPGGTAAQQLRLGVGPVLVDDELVLRGALVLGAPAARGALARLVRRPAEEVAVVSVLPPLHVVLAVLGPHLPLGLQVVPQGVRRPAVEHLRAFLLVGAVFMCHLLAMDDGLRVAVPLEVVRRQPAGGVVQALGVDGGRRTAEKLRLEFHLPPEVRVDRLVVLHPRTLGRRPLLLGRLILLRPLLQRLLLLGVGRTRKHLGGQEAHLLLPSAHVVLLGHEGLRHAPQVLLVVGAEHFGGRLVPSLARWHKGLALRRREGLEDARLEVLVVAGPRGHVPRRHHACDRGASTRETGSWARRAVARSGRKQGPRANNT